MFRNELLEELAIMFDEQICETYDSKQNSTNESIYINYGDISIEVNDDAKITFFVPFSLTIYSDRNDFCFGYLTTKYAMYKPNYGEQRITQDDGIESPSWDGSQILSSTKTFVFKYSTDFNREIERIKLIEFKK